MSLKYVVFDGYIGVQIIVFPSKLQHLEFAENVSRISFGSMSAISGGFVTNGECHGKSVSLMLDSRGDADTKLLKALIS